MSMCHLKHLLGKIINLAIIDIVLDTNYKNNALKFIKGESCKNYIAFDDFIMDYNNHFSKKNNKKDDVVNYNEKGLDEYLNKLLTV